MDSMLSSIVDKFLDVRYKSPHANSTSVHNKDQVLVYTKELFSIGSYYLEFADAMMGSESYIVGNIFS